MKKLEDISKADIFKTPEGYFDKLPGVIQSRIAKENGRSVHPFRFYALRYALPAAVLVAIFFWFMPLSKDTTAEGILASIDTYDLMAYLNDDEFTLDELLDQAVLDEEDANTIQQTVYSIDTTEVSLVLDEIIDIDSSSL
jgi:hypothetical protein